MGPLLTTLIVISVNTLSRREDRNLIATSSEPPNPAVFQAKAALAAKAWRSTLRLKTSDQVILSMSFALGGLALGGLALGGLALGGLVLGGLALPSDMILARLFCCSESGLADALDAALLAFFSKWSL